MCIMCAARQAAAAVDVLEQRLISEYKEGCTITIIIETPEGEKIPFLLVSSNEDIKRVPDMLDKLADHLIHSGVTRA